MQIASTLIIRFQIEYLGWGFGMKDQHHPVNRKRKYVQREERPVNLLPYPTCARARVHARKHTHTHTHTYTSSFL